MAEQQRRQAKTTLRPRLLPVMALAVLPAALPAVLQVALAHPLLAALPPGRRRLARWSS